MLSRWLKNHHSTKISTPCQLQSFVRNGQYLPILIMIYCHFWKSLIIVTKFYYNLRKEIPYCSSHNSTFLSFRYLNSISKAMRPPWCQLAQRLSHLTQGRRDLLLSQIQSKTCFDLLRWWCLTSLWYALSNFTPMVMLNMHTVIFR